MHNCSLTKVKGGSACLEDNHVKKSRNAQDVRAAAAGKALRPMRSTFADLSRVRIVKR
jgi:hypothetical protein